MKRDIPDQFPEYKRIIYAFAFSTVVTATIFLVGAIKAHNYFFWFLLYNLALAFIAPLVAWWLIHRLETKPWLSFSNIVLTLLWLGFLPNSFYMITDLIHAQTAIGVDLLYNLVLIMFFIFNAVAAGFLSLYMIHWALLKRFYYRHAHLIIGLVLLLCSFAIYLGRYLRWNSWDVVTNPAGILFDVSDTVLSPSTHPEVFATTASFFLLLTSMYVVIWQILRAFRKPLA
jgi:uncharacterized membrane protein